MTRWIESALVVVALTAVTWPAAWFTADDSWRAPAVAALVTVVFVGTAVASMTRRRWMVIAAQGVAVLIWIGALSDGLHRRGAVAADVDESRGLLAGAEAALDLYAQGVETIMTYPVPAPVTDGLLLLIVTGCLLAGWALDVLAVTWRQPVLAATILLVIAVATSSNTGTPQPLPPFLVTAAAWLGILGMQGLSRMTAWTTSDSAGEAATRLRHRQSTDRPARTGVRQHALLAGVTATAGLLIATALPAAVPHLPPAALFDGLSGFGAGGSGSGGQVSFTETLDLSADLADRSHAPVIRYRSEFQAAPPLRVLTTATYADGVWVRDEETTPPVTDLPQPAGLSPEVSLRRGEITVTENHVRAPQLAVPDRTVELDAGETGWEYLEESATLTVDADVSSYTAEYVEVDPLEELPAGIGESRGSPLPATSLPVSDVDPASAAMVGELAREITADAGNDIEIGHALQSYLRGPSFAYSLTLADPITVDGEPLDPISHFLTTRQGYCTQFATAMVMMARSLDIPARLALGFLPGEIEEDGSRTIVASNAHAWPELYIDGLGWTRFEPTPAVQSGIAPQYPLAQTETATQDQPEETATPETSTAEDPTVDPDDPSSGGGTQRGAEIAPLLWRAAVSVILTALLLSVLPALGWARRNAWRARATTAQERIEAEWYAFTRRLADLGVPDPGDVTPRQAARHYLRELGLGMDDDVSEVLARVVRRVEDSRYAVDGADVTGMRRDADEVLTHRRDRLGRLQRLVAGLFPRSAWAPAPRHDDGRSYWPARQPQGSASASASTGPQPPGR